MTATIIKGNRTFKCPHCKEAVGKIGDFVIPGQIGYRSISRNYGDCGSCDGIFSVEKTSDKEYKLTPVEGKYGDHRL